MNNQIPIKLTFTEIGTLSGMVEQKIQFFKNELKKQPTVDYKNFCVTRIAYYENILDKFNNQVIDVNSIEKLRAWKLLKRYNVKFHLDFVHNRTDFTYLVDDTLIGVVEAEETIFNAMKIVLEV